MTKLFSAGLIVTLFISIFAQDSTRMSSNKTIPSGYWPVEKSQPIIDKTQTIRLDPDFSQLSEGERKAVAKLLEAGQVFQKLYEEQRHPEALSSYRALEELDKRTGSTPATQNLLTLYRLFQGPIATTLENKREAFLPVAPIAPGKNVYPKGATKETVDSFLNSAGQADQLRPELFDLRTVVRTASVDNLRADLAQLKKYPALQTLHPKLPGKLQQLMAGPGAGGFYAIPYSLAYADAMMKVYGLLNDAADAVQKDDDEFARYLRNRARDLLSNDYESGDASWVTGRFKNLNAQIGSYETYDDELYGVKTFFAFCLFKTRQQETTALRQAMKGLQALEDSLPYAHH